MPADPSQDFYGESGEEYLSTTIPLFRQSGLDVLTIGDILRMGVYITNAVKTPKTACTIEKSKVRMIAEDIAAMAEIIRN